MGVPSQTLTTGPFPLAGAPVKIPVGRLLEVFFSGSAGSRSGFAARFAATRRVVLDAAEPAEITVRQAMDESSCRRMPKIPLIPANAGTQIIKLRPLPYGRPSA